MTADAFRHDPDSSWRDDAACLEHPTEWFTGPHEPGDTRRAIEVCTTCPVRQPCLEAALEIEVTADLGIWGATTPATRRRLRREQAQLGAAKDTTAPFDQRGDVEISALRLELFENEHGDHLDRTGRVIVFELHGEPPYMLMIDGKPRARTSTVRDAAGLAARFIANTRRSPDGREHPVPGRVAPRRTETVPNRR